MSKIKKIMSREILDSRGYPTVETEVYLQDGTFGRASCPSGASKGKQEAVELRDNDPLRFCGKGVKKSVHLINKDLNDLLHNYDCTDQNKIDLTMINFDGTKEKSNVGANSILSVSLAVAKAASKYKKIPFFQYISEINNTDNKFSMPLPMINIINGGKHSNNNLDIQEFMIRPIGAKTIKEAIETGAKIFHFLGKILKSKGMSTAVGDEGGYAPNLKNNEEALQLIKKSIENSGYVLGKNVSIAIDCAASELFSHKEKKYILDNKHKKFTYKEFTDYLEELSDKYSISSIEDGQHESDWNGFKYQTKKLGKKIQIVGDDLFVTNSHLLKKGIKNNIANAILIKPNQIGTLTETLKTIKIAQKANYKVIISHRSGETEDVTIADLSVGTNAGQIKTGSMSRTERVAKYNQLIRIEERIGIKLASICSST